MSTLDKIVERQIAKWQAERNRLDEEQAEPPSPLPNIAISREYGALGSTVGRLVADELGYGFWDRELVHSISERIGIHVELLARLDENTRSGFEMLIDGLIRGGGYAESDYLRQLVRVVGALAERGSAVFVGRGSQYIIHPDRALRVRLVSPLPARIKTLRDRLGGGTDKELRGTIVRAERERAAFIKHNFKRDLTDPTDYDLVLNMGSLTTAQACAVILAAYQTRFPAS